MNTKKVLLIAGLAVFIAAPLSANAQLRGLNTSVKVNVNAGVGSTSASTSISVKTKERIEKGKERADQEIARRIKALTELNARVQTMRQVSATQKTNIATWTQTEIAALGVLRTKISAATDLAVLKTDIQSITKSYRIFALIIPQGQIAIASNKIMTAADLTASLSLKLKARIEEARVAGKDVSALVTAQANIDAKVADAKVQAQAAVTTTGTLTPDGGDEAKAKANRQALVDARAKLKVAQKDLQSARDSAKVIVRDLKKFGINASVNSTTTVR